MANRQCGWLACAGLMFLTGCVEQRFVITSDPPGAKVFVNNKPAGFTPCDVPFTYYGTYKFTLEKDGCETIIEDRRIVAPWYAYPPIDFFAENIYPFKTSDIERQDFKMTPVLRANIDQLKTDAAELRRAGQALPPPSKPVNPNTGRPLPPPAPNPWPNTVPPPKAATGPAPLEPVPTS